MARKTPAPTGTAAEVIAELAATADAERAVHNTRYFKTGPGEYGEGDRFVGCGLTDIRAVTRRHRRLPLDEVDALLDSPFHEHRLAGVIVLTLQFKADAALRAEILARYLAALERGAINNWDLVDASAAQILGAGGDEALWTTLTAGNLWQRRAAAIATFAPLKAGDAGPSVRIATLLLHDRHDLIHKAVGWVLRDVGAKVDEAVLLGFLDRWAPEMPRTMLRYALEKLDPGVRRHYLTVPRVRADTPSMRSNSNPSEPKGDGSLFVQT